MRNNLYTYEPNVQTRWATFENPKGEKGKAGMTNNGAKGAAFELFAADETKILMEANGSGVVTRIWLTIDRRDAVTLGGVKLRMFWDGAENPAVDVPLGDFFCAPFGKLSRFENAFFASPEGKSFNCFIPMPFQTAVRIELYNGTGADIGHLFYEVDYELRAHDGEILYFHCVWNESGNRGLTEDYTLLPTFEGAGKVIGVCIGVKNNKGYGATWWGEGEVKAYIDGDTDYPTLCGTGAEDYIGTGWGLGAYANRTQGCPVASDEEVYAFYRMHERDPIHFAESIRLTIQAIGGGMRDELLKADKSIAPYKVVTRDNDGAITYLAAEDYELTAESPDGWYNFYRLDDYRSAVYFYAKSKA